MYILGIESTCDETAASVVVDGQKILSNVIASQADLHAKYGGVYPEVASRRHCETIIPVVIEAIEKAGLTPNAIDAVAVAHTPGLIGPLVIGVNSAKGLAMGWGVPLIGVNHVEAHLYAAMMGKTPELPALGIVVSGGHTFLTIIHSVGEYEIIGQTIDDAIGEAFDKTARVLELPYPGGPHIEQLALEGDPTKFSLKAGVVKGKPLDFSFSGLKTNVLYAAKGANASKESPLLLTRKEQANLAAAFQETAFRDLLKKTQRAAHTYSLKAIYMGGGVTMNQRLRALFEEEIDLPLHFPEKELCLDNAAMIAGLAFHKEPSGFDLEPQPRSSLIR